MSDSLHELISFENESDIFAVSDEDPFFYIIEHGSVEIWQKENDQKIVLKTLTAGDLFGEEAYLENRPRTTYATAIEETSCVRVSVEALKTSGNTTFLRALLKVLFYNLIESRKS